MVARINTVAFHGVEILARKFLPIIFVMALLFHPFFPAHAFSCVKESTSIEKAYIKADVVFSGTAKGNNEDGSVLFLVNEYYKSSASVRPQEINIFEFPGSRTILAPNAEFIIYGEYKDNDPNKVKFSVCDKTKITPETIQDWSIDPEKYKKRLEGLGPILLVGKVLEAKHISIGRKRGTKSKSEIRIQIQHVYSNQFDGISLVEGNEIRMDTDFCGQEMMIGREYIISANRGKLRIDNGMRLDPKVDILYGFCMNMFPMDIKEKDILRNLSKFSENKDGSPH